MEGLTRPSHAHGFAFAIPTHMSSSKVIESKVKCVHCSSALLSLSVVTMSGFSEFHESKRSLVSRLYLPYNGTSALWLGEFV